MTEEQRAQQVREFRVRIHGDRIVLFMTTIDGLRVELPLSGGAAAYMLDEVEKRKAMMESEGRWAVEQVW